jgi:DNA-binding CsgD family transcriptional regulator
MIPQNLEIIRRLEIGKSQREVGASYNIESSTVNGIRERKNQLLSCTV